MIESLSKVFQESLRSVLNKKRFVFIFSFLCVFGEIFLVFSNVVSISNLRTKSLILGGGLFFIIFSLIVSMGVVDVLLLLKEKERVTLKVILKENWKKLWNSLIMSVPFFLLFVFLVICFAIVNTTVKLPTVGSTIGVIFVFVPFLLSGVSILLFFFSFVALFFFTPIIATQSVVDYQNLFSSLKDNALRKIIGFFIAFIPLLFSWKLALLSLNMMLSIHPIISGDNLGFFFQRIIMVIPFALVLTPSISFFFNFSLGFNYLENKKTL